MFPRFYLHHFALRWSHFTLSILLSLLQVRIKSLHMLCPVRALKINVAPAIGENLSSCWYVLALATVGLPHRSTEFLTGWGMLFHSLFRWLMRCVVFLYLSAFGHILLGAWLPLELFLEGSPREYLCSGRMVLTAHFYHVIYLGSLHGSGLLTGAFDRGRVAYMLLTGAFLTEKSEEQMARSPV